MNSENARKIYVTALNNIIQAAIELVACRNAYHNAKNLDNSLKTKKKKKESKEARRLLAKTEKEGE